MAIKDNSKEKTTVKAKQSTPKTKAKTTTTTTTKSVKKTESKVKPKAVTKTATKKVKPKVATKSKATKKTVKRAKPEQYFFLNDGKVLKSINELAKQMDEIADEIFHHHVTDERHDFANWISDVFEEVELAQKLIEAERNKEKNHYVILKYIVKGK
ncbi:hypothetical protein BVX95_02400 [archaeon D22]|nr:hypothetical protein BVX95_02400 [archaeon D22]